MNGGDIALLVGIVLAITQAIKNVIKLKGPWAIVLSAVVTLGVVGWHYAFKQLPFDFIGFIVLAVSVFAAANGGYGLIKRASGI